MKWCYYILVQVLFRFYSQILKSTLGKVVQIPKSVAVKSNHKSEHCKLAFNSSHRQELNQKKSVISQLALNSSHLDQKTESYLGSIQITFQSLPFWLLVHPWMSYDLIKSSIFAAKLHQSRKNPRKTRREEIGVEFSRRRRGLRGVRPHFANRLCITP